MNHKSIEDILLQKDKRGIASLRQYLPTDYASQSAKYLLQHLGPTVITTGFYILYGGTVETDGPPGAKAIGNALESLGQKVIYLTDRYCKPIMDALASPTEQTIEFPITDADKSIQFAREFLRDIRPSLLISIERCSPSSDGIYRNMLSKDVSGFTAKIDRIFDIFPHSIGIGDGGNEIGMGKLQAVIPNHPKLPQKPVTRHNCMLLPNARAATVPRLCSPPEMRRRAADGHTRDASPPPPPHWPKPRAISPGRPMPRRRGWC